MAILQSNPGAGYFAHKADIDAAVARALESRWYILGREVAAFEAEFAAYLSAGQPAGAGHAVGVASGTDALQVALRACNIGAGDLVYAPSHTAVATITAIVLAGATPVFVDIDLPSYTITAGTLEAAIAGAHSAGRPRAVIPVHLYGHPAEMMAITSVAKRHELVVIEDCAQSHGAKIGEQLTGSIGDMAAFSFYPTKNLGALGDGGAVVSNNSELAAQARLVREYGWKERYVSAIHGMNSRLDELQAAILRSKLGWLDADNARRTAIAARYTVELSDLGFVLPTGATGVTHAWHQYVIRTPARDALREYLRERGIGTLVHYPVPVHLQPAYAGYTTAPLPNTEAAAAGVLSLPMYPELQQDEVEQVIAVLRKWPGPASSSTV